MNFPQRQLSLRTWWMLMLCVGSQSGHAADVPADLPAVDGPFASNLEHVGNAVRVRGLNVNLLGEVPLGSRLSLTGRLGANYARTRMDLATNPAVPTGAAHGFGLSYGVGMNWDVSERWSASADLNRHDFKFVTGRDNVDTATLGLRYRY